MIVRARLLGEFRKHLGGRAEPLIFELADAARVSDLFAALEIDRPSDAIVGVNGQLASPDSQLADGDEVTLVSPMSGG
jgi:molybdopterin converting factor small subunit